MGGDEVYEVRGYWLRWMCGRSGVEKDSENQGQNRAQISTILGIPWTAVPVTQVFDSTVTAGCSHSFFTSTGKHLGIHIKT